MNIYLELQLFKEHEVKRIDAFMALACTLHMHQNMYVSEKRTLLCDASQAPGQ